MVFMGIVCMITFVVGTALIDLANSAARRPEERKPGRRYLDQGQVKRMTSCRCCAFATSLLTQFLYRVIATRPSAAVSRW